MLVSFGGLRASLNRICRACNCVCAPPCGRVTRAAPHGGDPGQIPCPGGDLPLGFGPLRRLQAGKGTSLSTVTVDPDPPDRCTPRSGYIATFSLPGAPDAPLGLPSRTSSIFRSLPISARPARGQLRRAGARRLRCGPTPALQMRGRSTAALARREII